MRRLQIKKENQCRHDIPKGVDQFRLCETHQTFFRFLHRHVFIVGIKHLEIVSFLGIESKHTLPVSQKGDRHIVPVFTQIVLAKCFPEFVGAVRQFIEQRLVLECIADLAVVVSIEIPVFRYLAEFICDIGDVEPLQH